MQSIDLKCAVEQSRLANGLTILVKPSANIPEVDVQLWYNVGSKHELDSQRGVAHLIEHMIFKGTKSLLSETDLDRTVQHFSGYTNAFTSYDYTAYVFRFPSASWTYALQILADCMVHARFDEDMLNSEFKAVIQELKMYRDNYKSLLMEKMLGSIIAPHPYHHPIIGYKEDLWNLYAADLHAFYRQHYTPANATLVVVGDVAADIVFAETEKYFGHIPNHVPRKQHHFPMVLSDMTQKTITLWRNVSQPWCCYAYVIPGLQAHKNHIAYLTALLLARGKISRLHARIVDTCALAASVECFDYELFEKQLFYITLQPFDLASISDIEHELQSILQVLAQEPIPEWELAMLKKKAESDMLDILESNEQTATFLGQYFTCMQDTSYIESYFERIRGATAQEIQLFIATYLTPSLQHAGYIKPICSEDEKKLEEFQEVSDKIDHEILSERVRSSRIEAPHFSKTLPLPPLSTFCYPKPHVFLLSNGLEVYWYHNKTVPRVAVQLHKKANYHYDKPSYAGIAVAHSRMLLEGTQALDGPALHRIFEENAISFDTHAGGFRGECLTGSLENFLRLSAQVLQSPAFKPASLEKVKRQQINDLQLFWDEPFSYVSQIARETLYGDHPYARFPLGTEATVSAFTADDIATYHQRYVSPEGAILVLVGDLGCYTDKVALASLLEDIFSSWKGEEVEDLVFPELSYQKPLNIARTLQRDQATLAFMAPSIARIDHDYDALAIIDTVLTGGLTKSMSSRLFALREQTGLFYTIGGSLLYGAGRDNGMVFIKTMVSPQMLTAAENEIRKIFDDVQKNGIASEEISIAKRAILQSSIQHFENNMTIASVFLFLKKYNFPFDLFDKRGANLSIINNERICELARVYCDSARLSTIRLGRV